MRCPNQPTPQWGPAADVDDQPLGSTAAKLADLQCLPARCALNCSHLQAEGHCIHGCVEHHTPTVTLLLNHVAGMGSSGTPHHSIVQPCTGAIAAPQHPQKVTQVSGSGFTPRHCIKAGRVTADTAESHSTQAFSKQATPLLRRSLHVWLLFVIALLGVARSAACAVKQQASTTVLYQP